MPEISELIELDALLADLEREKAENSMFFYQPTKKQFEFHEKGSHYRQRLLMAGNQTGKTLAAGMEIAYHMTGLYPKWWPGYRFSRPVVGWAAGVTCESTRDNPQRILLGRKRQWGTGTIPKALLVGQPVLGRGVPDEVDSFSVKHVSGGVSTLWFKNYAQGREKFQGETLDFFWGDEEMPFDIYMEALTRLNRRRGLFLMTFTPLLGMTEVVSTFLRPRPGDTGKSQRAVIQMTLDDATFYTKEEREEIANQYSEVQREARVKGLPALGEGLVYPVPDEQIKIDPFPIPSYFRRLAAIDFGIGHPTAVVWIAHDPDSDTIYVTDVYRGVSPLYAVHVDAILQRPKWIPVAWPHDGLKTEPKTGQTIADLYRKRGVMMLPISARYDDDSGGPQKKEPAILEILGRMETGRFKVFAQLTEWFEEKNLFHRKEGKVVALNDDVMMATIYAVMMLRYARNDIDASRLQERAIDGSAEDAYGGFEHKWV